MVGWEGSHRHRAYLRDASGKMQPDVQLAKTGSVRNGPTKTTWIAAKTPGAWRGPSGKEP